MFYDAGVIKFLAFCMPSNYGEHKKEEMANFAIEIYTHTQQK
jgi:hypothetical protein